MIYEVDLPYQGIYVTVSYTVDWGSPATGTEPEVPPTVTFLGVSYGRPLGWDRGNFPRGFDDLGVDADFLIEEARKQDARRVLGAAMETVPYEQLLRHLANVIRIADSGDYRDKVGSRPSSHPEFEDAVNALKAAMEAKERAAEGG